MSGPLITVVGIGAQGFEDLGAAARSAITGADVVYGSDRQLTLIPNTPTQELRAWPTPLAPALDELLRREREQVVVLASGDPMLHGIGATLAKRLGPAAIQDGRLAVIPYASAFALACARMGWAEHETLLLSAVIAPVEIVSRVLTPGRQIVLYGSGADLASRTQHVLQARGYGASQVTVLERLGAADERVSRYSGGIHDTLTSLAIEVRPAHGTPLLTTTPGLPDTAFIHDGALTKRHVRAVTLAALQPAPGQLLWDVGAGSGSITIEWLRAEPTATAIAVEARADRAARLRENAAALGVPERLTLVEGAAPEALEGLKHPDAIFIGGGLTRDVLELAGDALKPGGRLVVNAVTIEAEQLLVEAHAEFGGELVRLEVAHAEPLGSYTAWRPALPIVQWEFLKE